MGLEHLKRWHWALIGLLFGAMFGGTRVFWRDISTEGVRTFDRLQFEDVLDHRADVRNLVLHPALDGQEWVTGEIYELENGKFGPRLMRQRPGTTQPAQERAGRWVSFPMLAAEENSKHLLYKSPNPVTGAEYMAYLQKSYTRANDKDFLSYKMAWWEIPKYTIAVYSAAGVVIVGGVFATIVNLLTGAGFGSQKKEKDEYDLSRFKSGPELAPATAKVEADPNQLDELNARLEENVADMFVVGKSAIEQEDEEEAAAIKQLQTQAMDATETVAEREAREAKEYKGEFYPVVKPGGQPGKKP